MMATTVSEPSQFAVGMVVGAIALAVAQLVATWWWSRPPRVEWPRDYHNICVRGCSIPPAEQQIPIENEIDKGGYLDEHQ